MVCLAGIHSRGYSLMSSECNETESSDSGIDDGYVIISSSFFKCDELCELSFLVLRIACGADFWACD